MASAGDMLEVDVVLTSRWKRALKGVVSAIVGVVSLGDYAPVVPRERILLRCKG